MSTDYAVVVDGVRLTYKVAGLSESPTMVLLHALGQRADDWAPVTSRFAELFQVFAFDFRGHGESDRPGVYSFQGMTDDIIGAVERLNLESITLVGHSMGGVAAYLLAMQRPDLITQLVIEDVSPPYAREQPVPDAPSDVAALGFDWAVVPAIIGEVNAGSRSAWEGLCTIDAPTLLIGGGPGSHIPEEKLMEVARRIPLCDLVTIAAGHNVHASRPDDFVDAVLDWMHH